MLKKLQGIWQKSCSVHKEEDFGDQPVEAEKQYIFRRHYSSPYHPLLRWKVQRCQKSWISLPEANKTSVIAGTTLMSQVIYSTFFPKHSNFRKPSWLVRSALCLMVLQIYRCSFWCPPQSPLDGVHIDLLNRWTGFLYVARIGFFFFSLFFLQNARWQSKLNKAF